MTVLQATILGFVQGLTEFLPVSSSGHLMLLQAIFSRKFDGLQEVPLTFDIMLHLATLFVVVIFYRKKIAELICVIFRFFTKSFPPSLDMEKEKSLQKMIISLIATTFITALIGVFTIKIIPYIPDRLIAVFFLFTAFLLFISSVLHKESSSPFGLKKGLFIGVLQGISTLPGISRSGSTTAASLLCGAKKSTSLEYSFLASIPAIFGAFLLGLRDIKGVSETIGMIPIAVGFLVAFATGYISLHLLSFLIKKKSLVVFCPYLVLISVLGIIFL